MRIAFVGLGNMGAPMAQNLLKAGHELTVFDLVAASADKLVVDGATGGRDAADAVRNAEVVITMLPSSHAVKRLYLGDGGVLAHAAAGALLIDSSTISPEVSREVAAAAGAKGLVMIDAPVSGGTAGAAAGTLTFIVGGEPAALERARPLLEKMGKNVFHAGASGAGQIAKICNNMLLGIHMLGTCEAINLGARLGLDPKVLSDVMAKSSGRNWSLDVYNPWPGVMENVPASREYKGGFGTDLMLKDLGLSQDASQSAGVATPLGALTRQLYQLHSGRGYGALDFSSIVDALRTGT